MSKELNVGVVGATGQVGERMLEILDEREFPVGKMSLYASERSAGANIQWQDRNLTVQSAETADFENLDIAFMSAGAVASKKYAPVIARAGALVIDNSSAWRNDPDVPLVVSEVNPETMDNSPKMIIANPNCTTMIAMPVLKPLHDEAELTAMYVETSQAVSGAGRKGIKELSDQVLLLAQGKEITRTAVFPEQIAYNVVPVRGDFDKDSPRDTVEELKLIKESRKILGIEKLAIDVTCTSVDVVTGHALDIKARFKNAITPERAEKILKVAGGVELVGIATPWKAQDGDASLVSRIRQSRIDGIRGLQMFIAGDNLRKGAALNAVQIGEVAIQRGLI